MCESDSESIYEAVVKKHKKGSMVVLSVEFPVGCFFLGQAKCTPNCYQMHSKILEWASVHSKEME
jgi:hypothetical protein